MCGHVNLPLLNCSGVQTGPGVRGSIVLTIVLLSAEVVCSVRDTCKLLLGSRDMSLHTVGCFQSADDKRLRSSLLPTNAGSSLDQLLEQRPLAHARILRLLYLHGCSTSS